MGKFVTGPKILWKVIVRELHQLVSRPIYLFSIVIAPLLSYAFFLSLMDNGLPEELPTAVVDLDHSATSRNLTRQARNLLLYQQRVFHTQRPGIPQLQDDDNTCSRSSGTADTARPW